MSTRQDRMNQSYEHYCEELASIYDMLIDRQIMHTIECQEAEELKKQEQKRKEQKENDDSI